MFIRYKYPKRNIQTGYYLELLTPKKMELLGSNNSKITLGKNEENIL